MNPRLGEAFVIPKGAPVHSMRTGDWTPAGRKMTVYPYGVDFYSGLGTVVTWAGAGGYWRRVRVLADGTFVQGWPS